MKAKELFEKLGYKLVVNDENCIEYKIKNNANPCIRFNKKDKTIYKFWWYFDCDKSGEIELEELQAINKQVEELGWNER